MGADFIYTILPLCKKTNERKAELKEFIESITLDNYEKIMYPWQGFDNDDDLEEGKAEILYALDEYWNLDGRRDTAYLCLDPQDVTYILSGGMSCGDGPTDSFDVMLKLEGLWEYFLKYAKEDLQNV